MDQIYDNRYYSAGSRERRLVVRVPRSSAGPTTPASIAAHNVRQVPHTPVLK